MCLGYVTNSLTFLPDVAIDLGCDMSLTGDTKEYLIEECRQLREAILQLAQRLDDAERNALLASGAIWAWLAVHERTIQYELAIWLPSFISTMFALKAIALRFTMYKFSKYIGVIEDTFDMPGNLNWQSKNRMIALGWPVRIGLWPIIYWGALITANICLAFLFPDLISEK